MLFIVYHKRIYDISHNPENVIYVAVNENIEKDETDKYNIIKEWELSNYNSDYQRLGFNESSFIIHLDPSPYDIIGICQYDMFVEIPETVQEGTCIYWFGADKFYSKFVIPTDLFFEEYNKYFKKNIKWSDIYNTAKRKLGVFEIPGGNSFFMTSSDFKRLQPFWILLSQKVMPFIVNKWLGYAGTFMERFIGMTILMEFEVIIKIPFVAYDFSKYDYPNGVKSDRLVTDLKK